MLELINVFIDTLDIDALDIHWEVRNTGEQISNYSMDLYRSEAPVAITEFEYVASDIDLASGIYTDNTLSRMSYSINRNIYYYLKVIETSSGINKNYGPYYMTTTPDYAAIEIIRRKNIVLTNPRYGARTFKILKRRTWGDYCSRCFDPITQRSQDPSCTTCYGTGIEGGYFDSITLKGYRSQRSYRSLLNLFGVFEDTDVSFVMQGHPLLNVNDTLVDELNTRYKILDPVRHTEKGMYVLEQQVRADIIPTSDIIYKLDV